MRFFKYIFCAVLFAGAALADTININWINDGSTYAQTTCTVGGDVILPTPPTKRGHTFVGWTMAYTPLEYIENNRFFTDTRISTGITYAQANKIEANIEIITDASKSNIVFCGGTTIVSYPFISINKNHGSATVSGLTEIETTYVNGILTCSYTTADTQIISISGWSDGTWTGVYKYKYVKIYKDTTLLAHFVPVKRNSDSAIGMYDTVSGQFFTNAGTGKFIAGPVVENQNLDE